MKKLRSTPKLADDPQALADILHAVKSAKPHQHLHTIVKPFGIKANDPAVWLALRDTASGVCRKISEGRFSHNAAKDEGIHLRHFEELASLFPELSLMLRRAKAKRENRLGDDIDDTLKRGRRSTFTQERGLEVINQLRAGLAIKTVADNIGVPIPTLTAWRRQNAEFSAAFTNVLNERKGTRWRHRDVKLIRRDMFNEETARLIIDELRKGRTLTQICEAEDMPSRQTVKAWANRRPKFKSQLESFK